jgi:hypothetical protein
VGNSDFGKDDFIQAKEYQRTISNSITRAMAMMDNMPDKLLELFEGQRQMSQAFVDAFSKVVDNVDATGTLTLSQEDMTATISKINSQYRDLSLQIKKDLLDLPTAKSPAAIKATPQTTTSSTPPSKNAPSIPVKDSSQVKAEETTSPTETKPVLPSTPPKAEEIKPSLAQLLAKPTVNPLLPTLPILPTVAEKKSDNTASSKAEVPKPATTPTIKPEIPPTIKSAAPSMPTNPPTKAEVTSKQAELKPEAKPEVKPAATPATPSTPTPPAEPKTDEVKERLKKMRAQMRKDSAAATPTSPAVAAGDKKP